MSVLAIDTLTEKLHKRIVLVVRMFWYHTHEVGVVGILATLLVSLHDPLYQYSRPSLRFAEIQLTQLNGIL